MSSQKPRVPNANNYHHKGVVVVEFFEKEVNGSTQVYASGFAVDDPKEKVAIAMMQPEGFKRHLAQIELRIYEKQHADGSQEYLHANGTQAFKSKEAFDEFIKGDSGLQSTYNRLMKSRANADSLSSKQERGTLPMVLMFDNANKLGAIGDLNFYEAKWIKGLAGNLATKGLGKDNSEDAALEAAFSQSIRSTLSNIHVKYDKVTNKPVHVDIRAIDRVANLPVPTKMMSEPDYNNASAKNRDMLAYALSNKITSNGVSVERTPFTYLNIKDKDGTHKETISLYNEEFKDTRKRAGDSGVVHSFQRPKDAVPTLSAYIHHQDFQTKPLKELILSGKEITADHSKEITAAYNADKTRAVLSALMGLKFAPLINRELIESIKDKDLQKQVAIQSNVLNKLHGDLVTGALDVRMVNGTSYPVGARYRERLIAEMTQGHEVGGETSLGKARPISGAVDVVTARSDNGDYLKINSYNSNNSLLFSPSNISAQVFELGGDKPSTLFTPLVTVNGQSVNEVAGQVVTMENIDVKHSPLANSVIYPKAEFEGVKVENPFEVIEIEKSRLIELAKVEKEVADLSATKSPLSAAEAIFCNISPSSGKPSEIAKEQTAEPASADPELDKKRRKETSMSLDA